MTGKRIQMSRQEPWREANPDAIIVARPTWLGNPFRAYEHCKGKDGDWGVLDLGRMRTSLAHGWNRRGAIIFAIDCFRQMIDDLYPVGSSARYGLIAMFEGKDVACWCALDEPCHADVYLELRLDVPAKATDVAIVIESGSNSQNSARGAE